MDDIAPTFWALEEHLTAGTVALLRIDADGRNLAPQPVCHHFTAVNPIDIATVSIEATYRHLTSGFWSLGVKFLPERLEAWETTKPDRQWLLTRIPAILEAANFSGLHYEGWTWEPHDGPPIGATDFQVFNNRTD